MIEQLIAIVMIIAVAYAAFWIIDQSFPAPIHMFAKLIVGLLALVAVLKFFNIY